MKNVAERKQRFVARTRGDILNAAARAFARTGFQSVTMRDIAREAGYTAAALYTYFDNKQEIVAALVKLVVDEFLAVVEEPMPLNLGFPPRLELLVHRVLDQAERRRDFFLLFLSMAQANQHPRATKQHPDPIQTTRMAEARLARWFVDNATPRELGGHDAEDVARFLSSLVQSFMGDWVVRGTPPGQFLSRAPLILDLFLHGVSGAQRQHKKRGGEGA